MPRYKCSKSILWNSNFAKFDAAQELLNPLVISFAKICEDLFSQFVISWFVVNKSIVQALRS